MCGIAGVVGRPGGDGARIVAAMCAAVRHRGPDSAGRFDEDDVHLGMRRLAIIDVARGEQPLTGEDDHVVAFLNGEIYNHADLRASLRHRGHRLRTDSDTEVIPHLYEDHGTGFVDHLEGMFATAVWDRRDRTLVLARDRVGKKPLFYAEHAGALWFGSELKCLLAAGELPLDIDPIALDLYLTYQYVPHPWTIYRGIRKLAPGHLLTWRDGTASVRRYWQLEYPPDGTPAPAPVDELAEQLRDHLLRATRLRMPSERPLGAFLSGGLDSASVVAAMAQQSAQPVRTFSIGFTTDAYDELPHARRVAQAFGTQHHELVVEPDALAILPVIAAAFDEPYADSSAIPSYYLARLAREHVVVALTGDGGDESFGGYTRYPYFLRRPTRLPAGPATALQRIASSLDARTRDTRAGSTRTLHRLVAGLRLAGERADSAAYARAMSYFQREQRVRLYTADMVAALGDWDSDTLIASAWARLAGTDRVNRLLGVDVETYLPGDLLPKVDITTMAHSLEARSPLLDQHLMEWSAALPGSLKVHGRTTKALMKQALRPWLPGDLIERPKQGFGIPREEWLAGPLRDTTHDLLLARGGPLPDLIEPAEVRRLLRPGPIDGSRGRRIWALLMLQLWHEEVHRQHRLPGQAERSAQDQRPRDHDRAQANRP